MSPRSLSEIVIRIAETEMALSSVAFGLTGCAEVPPFSSTQIPEASEPTPTSSPTRPSEATPTPPPTPSPESGATIPGIEAGKTLAIGGVNWEIRNFNTKAIAQLLGEKFGGWKIIEDPTTHSFFNLISTDQKGRYFLILPHGPNTHQWDPQNEIWINSQNHQEIFFSQVALPGGWDEAKKLAGPTAIPDMAFMLKNPDGKIQVGVVYKKDVLTNAGINPESYPDNYRSLPDGRFLFLGEQKTLTLQEGQTIEAVSDENGNLLYHQIINPDGTWFKVLTSWDQVTNAQQVKHMFEPIGIQIGDEITKIPYASEEMIKKVGIGEYGKLKDGTYVAYQTVTDQKTGQTKKLVVAQAVFTTNEKGEKVFKEWQEAVPLENLAVPDPHITNPELFDLTNPEAPIPQFANALNKTGINVPPEQIAKNISYETRKDKNGNPFVVAVYNLDPSLFPEEYRDLSGPIPLMITTKGENGEWRWKGKNILGLLIDKKDVELGVSLPEDWYFKRGRENELKTASENFNSVAAQGLYLLWNKPPQDRTENDFKLHDAIITYGMNHNINSITGLHLLWGYPDAIPDWLRGLNHEQLLKIIENHVTQVVTRYPKINTWSVVNEPYRNSDGIVDFWGSKFPNDYSWIETAFRAANNANPSATLILNDFGIEIPDTTGFSQSKTQRLLDIGKQLKQDNVPISGFGFQMHLYAKDFSDPTRTKKLMDAFAKNIKEFQSVYGSVVITELDVIDDPDNPTAQSATYEAVIKTALENGVKKIIIFGVTDKDSWKPKEQPLLFDENLQPKLSYYAVMKALLTTQIP
jgi:endo-1,4-beta-xylanase